MIRLSKTLPAPDRPQHLDRTAQWLAGEGAGSWFVIKPAGAESQYQITRYAPEGIIECKGIFDSQDVFNHNEAYEITYPSHCQKVTVLQNGRKIQLNFVE